MKKRNFLFLILMFFSLSWSWTQGCAFGELILQADDPTICPNEEVTISVIQCLNGSGNTVSCNQLNGCQNTWRFFGGVTPNNEFNSAVSGQSITVSFPNPGTFFVNMETGQCSDGECNGKMGRQSVEITVLDDNFPVIVNGPTTVAPGVSSVNYSVDISLLNGVNTYQWDISDLVGWSFVGPNDGSSITLNTGETSCGDLCVTVTNECGDSEQRCIAISRGNEVEVVVNDQLFCSGEIKSVSASADGSPGISWVLDNKLECVGSCSGSPINVRAKAGTSGWATIRTIANYTNCDAAQDEIDVWIGEPNFGPNDFKFDPLCVGHPQSACDGCIDGATSVSVVPNNSNLVFVETSGIDGNGFLYSQFGVIANAGGLYSYVVTATNRCGSFSRTYFIGARNCTGGGSPIGKFEADAPDDIAIFRVGEVMPNPITDKTTLNIESTQEEESILNVLNLEGQILLQMKAGVFVGNNTIEVDLSSLHSGMYILEVKGKLGSSVQKLLKL